MDNVEQANLACARMLEIRRRIREGRLSPETQVTLEREHDQLYDQYGGPYSSLHEALQYTIYGVVGEVGFDGGDPDKHWVCYVLKSRGEYDIECRPYLSNRRSTQTKNVRTEAEVARYISKLSSENAFYATQWTVYLGPR